MSKHNLPFGSHWSSLLLFLSAVTKHMDIIYLSSDQPADQTKRLEVFVLFFFKCLFGKVYDPFLCDLHLKDAKKIIAAQLPKYQPIRGREEGRKERWRERGDRCRSREQRQIYK